MKTYKRQYEEPNCTLLKKKHKRKNEEIDILEHLVFIYLQTLLLRLLLL